MRQRRSRRRRRSAPVAGVVTGIVLAACITQWVPGSTYARLSAQAVPVQGQVVAVPKPEAQPDRKPQAKPDAQPDRKLQAKPDAKPDRKPQAKPEPKSPAKPTRKPDPKPAPKPEQPDGRSNR